MRKVRQGLAAGAPILLILLLTFPKRDEQQAQKQREGDEQMFCRDGSAPGSEAPRVQKSSASSPNSAGSLQARLHLPPGPGTDQWGD